MKYTMTIQYTVHFTTTVVHCSLISNGSEMNCMEMSAAINTIAFSIHQSKHPSSPGANASRYLNCFSTKKAQDCSLVHSQILDKDSFLYSQARKSLGDRVSGYNIPSSWKWPVLNSTSKSAGLVLRLGMLCAQYCCYNPVTPCFLRLTGRQRSRT